MTKKKPAQKLYFNYKFLKKNKVELRDYQVNIMNDAYGSNTLVVLPTALGKTIIGVMIAAKYLDEFPKSKILVLAPTKPLVMQHCESFTDFFTEDIKCSMIIGGSNPLKRALEVIHSDIIFSTPQIIKNDLALGSYNLRDFSLVIFDEAHKARKNYAYTFVAEEYMKTGKKPFILGLTASPGKDKDVINELIQVLKIEKVCFKTHEDEDVREYIFPIDTYIERVNLPLEVVEVQILLKKAIQQVIDYFIDQKIIPIKDYVSKADFIKLNTDFRAYDLYGEDYTEYSFQEVPYILKSNPLNRFAYVSMAISGIYLLHMEEILTSQTPKMFTDYCEKIMERVNNGSKSAKRIVNSKYYKEYVLQQIPILKKIESPKIERVTKLVLEQFAEKKDSKIIIFTQFRDMAAIIKDKLIQLRNPDIRPERFVGQFCKENDPGLSQKMQQEIIKIFKNQNINVLVATSIAEEGLDIPNVDAVIFYEPVPSEIRLIQRRGRTGRHSQGKCYIICANETIDDVYLKVAFKKEEIMHRTLVSDDELEIITNINRNCEDFVPDEKNDEQIHKFFKNIEERKKITTEKNIQLIESIQESSGEKERVELLEDYGVNDITNELGNLTINRLKRTEENRQIIKQEKMKERIEKQREKIKKKIESTRSTYHS